MASDFKKMPVRLLHGVMQWQIKNNINDMRSEKECV